MFEKRRTLGVKVCAALVMFAACGLEEYVPFHDEEEVDTSQVEQEISLGGQTVLPRFQKVPGIGRVFELPIGLAAAALRFPAHEKLDRELVELGNLLYFDQRLSSDGSMSCASCHDPARGFAAIGFSSGVSGVRMPRTTSYGMNRAFGSEHDWVGGKTLEAQSISPILHPLELQLTATQLLQRVQAVSGYVTRFDRLVQRGILPTPAISQTNIGRALASFQRTLLSGGSAVDRFEAGQEDAILGEAKVGRKKLVTRGCRTCHSGGNYSDEGFHVMVRPPTEKGRQTITGDSSDFGKFKTPSLRDAARRSPYMHDGSIGSLVSAGTDIVELIKALRSGADSRLRADLSVPGLTSSPATRESIYLSPDIYDSRAYAELNSDLAALTDAQLRAHWISDGMMQGRRASWTFWVQHYLQLNAAVYDATQGEERYGQAIDHYLNVGRFQNLPTLHALAPAFFDADDYRVLNPRAAGIPATVPLGLVDAEVAATHYVRTGQGLGLVAKHIPVGYFIVPSVGYFYANGRMYCRFASATAMGTRYGRADLIGIPQIARIPANLANGGACLATSPPTPTTTVPAPATAIISGRCLGIACPATLTCPAGMQIRAVRVACKMRTANMTDADLVARAWDSLTVLEPAADLDGICESDGMAVDHGAVGLLPWTTRTQSMVSCDKGGCEARGQILCSQ